MDLNLTYLRVGRDNRKVREGEVSQKLFKYIKIMFYELKDDLFGVWSWPEEKGFRGFKWT